MTTKRIKNNVDTNKLYEKIMTSVSRIIKNHLNEAYYTKENDIEMVLDEYQYYLDVCDDEELGNLFNFINTPDFAMHALAHLRDFIKQTPALKGIDGNKFVFDRFQEVLNSSDGESCEETYAYQFANALHMRLCDLPLN